MDLNRCLHWDGSSGPSAHPRTSQDLSGWEGGTVDHSGLPPALHLCQHLVSQQPVPPTKAARSRWAQSENIQPLSSGTWTPKPPEVPTISFPPHQESGKSWALEGLNEAPGQRRIPGGRKYIRKGQKSDGKEDEMDREVL